MTLGIRKYLVKQPRTKRARKAVKFIRNRVAHYTKLSEENVKISPKLNNIIFKYYARHMTPVKLTVKIGTDTADVLPFEEKAATPTGAEAAKKQDKASIFQRLAPKVVKIPAEAVGKPQKDVAKATPAKPASAKPSPAKPASAKQQEK